MSSFPAGNGGVTYPSPDEWPVTVIDITAIQKGLTTLVTAANHGITLSSTASTPKVDFTQVKGMSQINGKFGFVLSVPNANQVLVDLDTSNFYDYTSGGYLNITGGSPPNDPLTNLFP